MPRPKILQISSEVETALNAGKPIVALESTVIAHGLPPPHNLITAQSLEKIIQRQGVTPATIAIIEGKPWVGLTDVQLKLIASSPDIRKVSIRDLPVAITKEWNGATTVASSIWIASRAGIQVFATGGIGGVHRGSTGDVSADLPELARTPIVVVCSGAKIVLDLPATREWLETFGVTVVGYGCDEMPAFYSRKSGLPVDVRANSPEEIFRLVRTRQLLGTSSALLVTVPVPEEAEVPAEIVEGVLRESLSQANKLGIGGFELTPFLLSRMAESSEGATLRANIALLENNARVAAEIAMAMMETNDLNR